MKSYSAFFCSMFLATPAASIMAGEVCSGINFTRDKLPCEKKSERPCGIRTLFLPRSQGAQLVRYLAGWNEYLPGCDTRAWGSFSLITEYAHSYDGDRIAHYLFGSTQLHFSGSQVPQRDSSDLLADYFGLATTFQGTLACKPTIENIVLDVNYYLGLDQWYPGLYTRMTFPIVISRWNLGIGCNEKNNSSAQNAPTFPAAYMSQNVTPAARSIKEALSGSFTFGDMVQPMSFGAFPCGREKKVGIAEIDLIAGYDFIADENSHAGIYLITVIPTGNVPRSEIIFEPLVGNGRLWEIGPGFSGHVDLIRHEYHLLSFVINGYLSKQFKKTQIRSFDLRDHGPMSRYMLLKEFNADGIYTGNLIQGIDFCTRAVRVGDSVKVDLAMKLAYYYDRFGLDIGYNVYGRTEEKLCLQPGHFPSDLNNRRFGIKGTEGSYYRVVNSQTGALVDTKKLNSVQTAATIVQGGPVTNPQPIQTDLGTQAMTWDGRQAVQSLPLELLVGDTLDLRSGKIPRQLTHTFFAHLSYTAGGYQWEPQLGIGGRVEIDGHDRLLSSLNQWALWLKLSASF